MCGVAPPHPFLLILRANWSDEPVLINIKETEMVKGTCTYASDEESAERNYQRIRPYCKLHSLITDSCSYVSLRLYVVGFPSGISDCRCKNYEAYIPTEKSTKSFEELQKINPDVIGWIRVNDTNINYPLVQTDNDDTYMNTDAEGNYSLSGAIFLHCANKPDFSDFDNIIYGHHMENT